jgi:AcrR family transcriptional regulator
MPRTKEQLEITKEQTRTKIINTAISFFSQKGYYGTSINDIAKEAGISKGLAYNYFESKQQLLQAIINDMLRSIGSVMSEIDKEQDPFEKISKLIINSFEYAKNNEELWRLYMRLMFQPDIINATERITTNLMDEIFQTIEKIFKKIGYKNVSAEARIFSATIDGVMLYYLMDPENFPLEKVKKLLLQKFSKAEIQKYLGTTG